MSETRTTEVRLPDDRPPGWANSLMKWALTKPGLQSTIGKQVAILSFEGRKSAKVYDIPVSYQRRDSAVTIITKRTQKWWHNFEAPTKVHLRLAGEDLTGEARIENDPEAALEFMTEFLDERPIDAKAYGLSKGDVTREKLARILPGIVMIRIELEPET